MRKLSMLVSLLALLAFVAVGCGGNNTGKEGLEPDAKQEQGADANKDDAKKND